MKFWMLLLTSLVLWGGCSRQNGPAVSVVSVHFQDVTLLETTVVFTLRVENDQPAPLSVNGSAHDIYINGLYVGKGLNNETLEIPRLSTATNDVTVHLSNLALATRFKSVFENKQFDYRIQSTFYGESWWGRTRSESEGKLDLKDFTPDAPLTNSPPAITTNPPQ